MYMVHYVFLHDVFSIPLVVSGFLEELRSRGLASMFLALWCPAYGITGVVIFQNPWIFWVGKGGVVVLLG